VPFSVWKGDDLDGRGAKHTTSKVGGGAYIGGGPGDDQIYWGKHSFAMPHASHLGAGLYRRKASPSTPEVTCIIQRS